MENLQYLITLKTQFEEIKSKIEFTKQSALIEALDYKALNDKAKIKLDGGSVTIRFKSVKPTPDTDSDLDSIKQDIDAESERIYSLNMAGIDALVAQISDLEYELSKLKSSKLLKKLEGEYNARVTEMTEIVPELAVSLK